MRLHIHCPGSLTDGLDSPSRGEGRWSQNLARVLAKEGHEVFVSGGGVPMWGTSEQVENVTMIPESVVGNNSNRFGVFDINVDSAWWREKSPMVDARKHFVLKWSIEDYTALEPLPKDHYLFYPLKINEEQFYTERCVNKHRTFFLPIPFGDQFSVPNFHKKGLLWTSKDIEREEYMRRNAEMVADGVLPSVLSDNGGLYVVWLMHSLLEKFGINTNIREGIDVLINGLLPYHRLRSIIQDCKLVVAINIPGSVLDAAFLGVPTLEWESGGFFNNIGRKHGVLIENGASHIRIKEVIDSFLTDKDLYSAYVKDMQNELSDNLNSIVVERFNKIVEAIF